MAATHPNTHRFPIVDSHIHLYAASHIPFLNWTADLPATHPLNRQNSIYQYRAATDRHATRLEGFIFLETDRKSGLADPEWTNVLAEVDFLVRIARDTPVKGEGHYAEAGKLVLGIVPWAPVPAGVEPLSNYVDQVRQHAGDEFHLIKGFRYLVQDKPAGVMLEQPFLDGLKYLGERDLTFDLGVDARSGGLYQLEEACTMMDRLYDSGSKTKIIINHLCKPNLRIPALKAGDHPEFIAWSGFIKCVAAHKRTYMKLSGMFSELPQQDEDNPVDVTALVQKTKPWVDVVFQAFGPSRIMFGSDWPVCNVGGPGTAKSWDHWYDLVDAILTSENCSNEDRAQVWAGTAKEAYNVTF